MPKKNSLLLMLCFCFVLLSSACGGSPATPDLPAGTESLSLTSPAFAEGESIPALYTCSGQDISPALAWDNTSSVPRETPNGTQSYAILMLDPDANGFVHWLLFNIPASARSLTEATPKQAELADGSRHGKNGWGKSEYGGPCPPSGTHHYVITLYALDITLDLPSGASAADFLAASKGHILAWGRLTGLYKKQ
jgi:Raf kinase inhibitor-like YbhB/YbcL family protein